MLVLSQYMLCPDASLPRDDYCCIVKLGFLKMMVKAMTGGSVEAYFTWEASSCALKPVP